MCGAYVFAVKRISFKCICLSAKYALNYYDVGDRLNSLLLSLLPSYRALFRALYIFDAEQNDLIPRF